MSSFIPEHAPFTTEQRAWLNGFFSGLAGIQLNADAAAVLSAAGMVTPSVAPGLEPEPEQEEFPWHDASLPIVDRMSLAEDKPIERKLMAAMAQLDCGSCGYLCQTYAEAIAAGDEKNLTLCSPGGKETAKMVKLVLKESTGQDSAQRAIAQTASAQTASAPTKNGATVNGKGAASWSRQNPFTAKLVESRRLNKPGSAKDTRHVVIDLSGSGIRYDVGDALGIYPTNCRDLVTEIIEEIGAEPQMLVSSPQGDSKSLLDTLVQDRCLKDPSDELIELIISRAQDSSLLPILTGYLEDGVPGGFDVLDALRLARGVTISATEFVATLAVLNPRLYSIASSQKTVGDTVHLTVGRVAFEKDGRERKGVASTLLADRLDGGGEIRVFRQANHGGFTVPSDPTAAMIMVGPGTGIAPFMAFLQERAATKASGNNWLFFGDQRSEFDFLYQDELNQFAQSGVLNRLDTAFSRDGEHKVYVQDRMKEQAAELWRWLSEGAYFYVCGDASRMALDVDRSLHQIVAQQGGFSESDARAYVANLGKEKRYVRDVY
ncbi:Sulfite reductase [NADPH] flavoprotein alpha-component [Stieleria varia]|uniref:assimilatory sulfite reductase (NADPH) n=2 Tax=Stieleria varia TaxID=2528005 RepID=A0A5C5ZQZ0_9BACT|nr:Sulfite reductase [NADPH] flavoprotein alpha-component [Stieleria varia]